MNTWFTSDTHFNHEKVIEYCRRPFGSVDEMNHEIIRRWNEVVQPGDLVYHLGDFAMGDRTLIPHFLAQLNGEIALIRGNHDTKRSLEYFPKYRDHLYEPMEVGGRTITVEMTHQPYHARQQADLVLCGHVHEKWRFRRPGQTVPSDGVPDHQNRGAAFRPGVPFANVGVDVRDFRPVSLAEIMKDFV